MASFGFFFFDPKFEQNSKKWFQYKFQSKDESTWPGIIKTKAINPLPPCTGADPAGWHHKGKSPGNEPSDYSSCDKI